ncbi:unnamed protein product, partial [Cyprideis torosa]
MRSIPRGRIVNVGWIRAANGGWISRNRCFLKLNGDAPSKRSPVPLMSVRRQERKNSRDSPIYFIKLSPSPRYLNNEILEHNKISDHPPATAISERKSMKKVHFMTNGKPSLLHFLKNNLSPPSTKKQETLESR